MANSPKQQDEGVHELAGELCQFGLGGHPPRRYFVVNLPFGIVRRIVKIEPYDPVTGKGEQRNNIPTHSRKLEREMRAGKFTPAPWAAGLRESHLQSLEIDEKRRKVKLVVSEANPLACLDGGHRFVSLNLIREKADAEAQKTVDNLTITVQIYLDPQYIRRDFNNLQAGRQVAKSLTKFIEDSELSSATDPKAKFKQLAKKVVWNLSKLPMDESFLSNDVNFTSSGGGKVDYSSITTLGGSDIGTSIGGGAKICLYGSFLGLFADEASIQEFLVNCYRSVWQGIHQYDEPWEYTDPIDGTLVSVPSLLSPGKMLRPNIMEGGTKGGTSLLLMLGNMLAFRMLAVHRKPEIPADEIEKLVHTAQEVLDDDVQGGGSGPAKRLATGEFARVYFADVVRAGESDEHDMHKLGAIDGVPSLLCNYVLTRSTLAVPKGLTEYSHPKDTEAQPARLSDPDQTDSEWVESDEPEEITVIGELDTGSDFEPPPPSRKGKGKKSRTTTGTMG